MQYNSGDPMDEFYDANTEALGGKLPRNAEAAPVITKAESTHVTFWGANDYAARRAIVEAAHAQALRLNARHDARAACQAQESKRYRDAIGAAHAEALKADKERTAQHLWDAYMNENFAGRCRMVENAYADALARNRVYDLLHTDSLDPVYRTAIAPAQAVDIDAIDIRTLHKTIKAEADQPYVAKVVTRAYVAWNIARTLTNYTKHYANYTAQDRLWLADHNANHAHRNGVLTTEEYTAIYHRCRAEGADPLKLIDEVHVALLTGTPVMSAVNAAAEETETL